MEKVTTKYGYICAQCNDKFFTDRRWTTRDKRNKSMLNHTKKTKHSMLYRTIDERISFYE